MNSYDRNRNTDILSGDIMSDADLKFMEGVKTPWDNKAKFSSGISQIAGGNPFGIASGIATMGGSDNAAGAFGQLGGLAYGSPLTKASAVTNLAGGSEALAGKFGNLANIADNPQGAALGMATKALTSGVGGPWGMVLGMGIDKVAGSALGNNAPSYDQNQGKRIIQGNKALYEDDNSNMVASNNSFTRGRFA